MESEGRLLILAPRGRDADVVVQVVAKAGTPTLVCVTLTDWLNGLREAAGAAIVTEEALIEADLTDLHRWLDEQPPWSDFPFIMLTTGQAGKRSQRAAAVIESLGNVVLLERPAKAETLNRAVAAALRARRRQYQARGLLVDRERDQERLRIANETLERRVEERTHAVESASATLAFALDSAALGSWDLDLVHDAATRSPRHDAIFGYEEPLASWKRANFWLRAVEEDRARAQAAIDEAIESGALDVEFRIHRPDGAIRWISLRGRVQFAESGEPVRMAGIVMDRTDQRTTEEAFRQAQKMEAIGQLTGGVAHDFNNLLTIIVGGLDMIMRRPDDVERIKRLAEAAMTAARRGEQLTQQLLAFSRRQILRPQTLSPNRLLLDFRPLAERAAGGAIELSFDLETAVDPIRVDPAQFQSAMLNLIVNARDAMSGAQSAPRIEVRSRNVHLDAVKVANRGVSPGPFVEVSISDTGSGISPEALAHVFEPFFTTKDVGKGTGLGLSQVYGFTRSAHGFVTIQSEVGRGTTFRLYFPRSGEPASAEQANEPSNAIPLRRAGEGDTVLLVEDDEQVLSMAVESLEELRYEVLVARNAAEALDHLKGAERIDILFSDVVMPGGMNGSKLALEARRIRPGLKVLLTSGYVDKLEDGQVIGRGDLTMLNKPYRRDELARSLRLILAGADN